MSESNVAEHYAAIGRAVREAGERAAESMRKFSEAWQDAQTHKP